MAASTNMEPLPQNGSRIWSPGPEYSSINALTTGGWNLAGNLKR